MHFYNSRIEKMGFGHTYKDTMFAGNNVDMQAQVFVTNDKLLLP
jgi:hypothetical protein